MWSELKDGWFYVSRSAPIRSILLLLALISLVGMPYSVLMPIFARNILHGGPHTLGFLMGASGVGALTGAIILAARKSVLGLGRLVAFSAAAFGFGLATFSQSRWLWLSFLLMFVTGYGMMQQMAASNTIHYSVVDEDKRGRVMSYDTMSFMGMAPFGSLLAGGVASRYGAPATLLVSGLCCIVGAVWFVLQLKSIRSAVRPIYTQLGIIPEVATGIQSASVLQTPPED